MRVAIIGTGLIGGSIGLAIKRSRPEVEVVGCDLDPQTARAAVQAGAADRVEGSVAEAAAGADLVFVAAPVSAIADAIAQAAAAAPDAVITDVGSTKARVVVEAEHSIGAGGGFVGGHPMAGSEDEGIGAARADLFDGAWWILTPTPGTPSATIQTVRSFVTTLGARVIALDPREHDELMAVISHLPQLLATTLMNTAAGAVQERTALLTLAAGGFRDVTRVAASNAAIWVDICRDNREAIAATLTGFSERLDDLRRAVETGDEQAIRGLLTAAREARRGLPGKQVAGDVYEVRMPVPDRPGVLADVTTTVGGLGVNIEDLEITHAAEGGRGTLRMRLIGEQDAARVVDALQKRGYEPKATRP